MSRASAVQAPAGTVETALASVLDVVREHARATDEQAAFPEAALAALRSSGLLGLLVPGEHGGMSGELTDMVRVAERIAREDLSVGLIFAMHCQQVATLVAYARPALRATLLPRIARGEVYLASVTTEAGRGGALTTSESPLTDQDGAFVLDRFAPIVTGGAYADGFLITMQVPAAGSPTEVSLVYADRAQLAVGAAGTWDPMGMRASHSLPMRIEGAVPADQVVGEHGGFRDVAMRLFAPLAHIGWAACWLGAASGALSRLVYHLRGAAGRQSYDTSSELLLTRLGRVRGRLDVVHATMARVIDLVVDGDDLSRPRCQLLLNTLKIEAAEQTFAAVHELIELAGLRLGYLKGSALWLERVFRDLRAASLNYGNDRLLLANGRLALLDPEVRLV
ncbi:acyl-CoA dehydrogenase family protein [Amycolatopsis mediterranei]|uniref:acyl-CoA dehydrogenase family protein n=1 Tax=Amycolatopsis mediterranei TaxID=33910 RepID=UPI00342FBBE8